MSTSAGAVAVLAKPEPHRLTVKERLQYGRSRRETTSRADLAQVHSHGRSFDPIQVLRSATEHRLPKLLPVKYARMSASPFAFFRGAVAVMAADLASRPNSGLIVQLCGDAHVQNMGSFESPDGRITFDLNDFDETIPGPWEWDVKRMAASLVLAGYESNHPRTQCSTAVDAFLNRYCSVIEELADQPVLVAARHQIHLGRAQPVSAALKQAERASPCDLLAKYTDRTSHGQFRFKHVEHVLWPVKGRIRQDVLNSLGLYLDSLSPDRVHLFNFFNPLDVAFKIVGTGSVGLRDYVVLLTGNGSDDPLFLQIKQEVRSAYTRHLEASIVYENQGRRVAEGQRRIQPLSDPFLGWARIGDHDYLVRQLNDHKGSIDLANLRGTGLNSLAEIAGELLARGHTRSGDPIAIKGYIGKPGKVVEAITTYALDYAAQTQHDFEQFQKAIRAKRIRTAA